MSSHRQILKSSAIIGSSSLINILLSLVRMRIVATVVGPAGVGLLGLLQSMVQTGAAIGGLGIASAAARDVAAQPTDEARAEMRRVVWRTTLALAIVGGIGTGLAVHVFGRAWGGLSVDGSAPWVGLATFLTIIAASQVGVLTGLRKIGAVAGATIVSGLAMTLAAIAALILLPTNRAVIAIVMATPVAAVCVGWVYLRRHRPALVPTMARSEQRARTRALLALGAALCVTGIVGNAGPLVIRAVVGETLGAVELGWFQASWTIASLYLGIILQSMSTDFLPRLSTVADDHDAFTQIVGEQMDVAVLLGGPVIVAMIGLTPMVLTIVYGADFTGAAPMLRWQLWGDVFRLVSWPLGFALIASRSTRRYLMLEVSAMLLFVASAVGLVTSVGLEGAGIAYALMLMFYVVAARLLTRSLVSHFDRRLVVDIAVVFLTATMVLIAGRHDMIFGGVLGGLAAAGLLARAAERLRALSLLDRLRGTR